MDSAFRIFSFNLVLIDFSSQGSILGTRSYTVELVQLFCWWQIIGKFIHRAPTRQHVFSTFVKYTPLSRLNGEQNVSVPVDLLHFVH